MTEHQNLAHALSFSFGHFRPSDRRHLSTFFSSEDGWEIFLTALECYLEGWAKADWISAYEIERIGIWIDVAAPGALRARTVELANVFRGSEHRQSEEVYGALLAGLGNASFAAEADLVAEEELPASL